jgi:hypothetical protein
MHTPSVQNGMVIGAQAQLDERAANAQREAKAFRMFLGEFLDAMRAGPAEPLSWRHTAYPFAQVLAELLEDSRALDGLCTALRTSDDIALYLANAYATAELNRYRDEGGL